MSLHRRVFISNFQGKQFKGTAEQLWRMYDTKSAEAEQSGDTELAIRYSQYSDHYKRFLTW